MIMIDWLDAMAITSAFSALLVAVYTWKGITKRKDRRRRPMWLIVAHFGVAGYWLSYYTYTLLVHWGLVGATWIDPSQFGPLFVRPGLTMTLAVTACGVIWQYYARPQ